MLTTSIRTATLAMAAGGLALAAPASALPSLQGRSHVEAAPVYGEMTANHGKDRGRHKGWEKQNRRDYGRYAPNRSSYQQQAYNGYRTNYGEPVYNNTRVWRGDDGRAYCRKSDGTTGLIIGGAAGALLGREIAGRGDRTLGTILGAAGGALLGKSVDSKVRCN